MKVLLITRCIILKFILIFNRFKKMENEDKNEKESFYPDNWEDIANRQLKLLEIDYL